MFLGVSVTLCDMEMTDEQRMRLGHLARSKRMEKFETKMAAYQAAGINAATWDRVERGQSVKDHTLVAAIKTLWPSAGGDWRHVLSIFDTDDAEDEHERMRDYDLRMESWVSELQGRIEQLEEHVYNRKDEEHVRSAANTQAGVSPADEFTPHVDPGESIELPEPGGAEPGRPRERPGRGRRG